MMRLVSWNVHGFRTARGRYDPGAALRVLERLAPDVVVLQEVEDRPWPEQPALDWLASRCGWQACPGPTLMRGAHAYGNAILSSLPVRTWTRHDLSHDGREPRGAVSAELVLPDGTPLKLIGTHLGLRRFERVRQLERLLDILGPVSDERVDVLAGDFNEWQPRSVLVRRLSEALPDGSRHATFPAWRPLFPLDLVRVRPAGRLARVSVVRDIGGASDHLPIVAELS